MNDNKLNYEELYTNLPKFDWNKIFNLTWELFKKTKWQFLGFFILSVVLISVIVGAVSGIIAYSEKYLLFILAFFLFYAFILLMFSGVYRYLYQGLRNNFQFNFNDFFAGFKKIGPIFLFTIIAGIIVYLPRILYIIIFPSSIDFSIESSNIEGVLLELNEMVQMGFVVEFIFTIYGIVVQLLLIHVLSIILNFDESVFTAIIASAKVVGRTLINHFLFFIVLGLILLVVIVGAGLLLTSVSLLGAIGMVILVPGMVLIYSFIISFLLSSVVAIFYNFFAPFDKDMLSEKVDSFGRPEENVDIASNNLNN